MPTFKKVWRTALFFIILLLAFCGVPLLADFRKKEQDVDNEVKTEIVEGLRDED